MTRPTIIRADTLDLQDHENPSAGDHHAGPNIPHDHKSIAPHQANAIMNVVHEQAQEQHDLIVTTNGVEENTRQRETRMNGAPSGSHEDMVTSDDEEEEGDEDMLDKMSSSPSISDEDIDFEFVYALHTFIATVEGQANATKGDTMVLLDDSNSYWWLVRVVKDSSIGYLPAEHIETPSERLARLNKHRNVDLSTPMLGDVPEKSKNPLRKAMKRRNAKTVQFAPPTYFDASEVEYSTEEEEDYSSADEEVDNTTAVEGGNQEQKAEATASTVTNNDIAETAATATATAAAAAAAASIVSQPNNALSNTTPKDKKSGPTMDARTSEESVTINLDDRDVKARKGAPLRNPDSQFFGDENQEPRRIILTPQILRDDASGPSTSITPITTQVKTKTSFDKIEKAIKRDDTNSPPPAIKDKDKKPKMSRLGKLFGKRGKKQSREEEIEDFLHQEKRSSESLRDDQRPKSSGAKEATPKPEIQTMQAPRLVEQPANAPQPQISQSRLPIQAPQKLTLQQRAETAEYNTKSSQIQFQNPIQSTPLRTVREVEPSEVVAPESQPIQDPKSSPTKASRLQQQHPIRTTSNLPSIADSNKTTSPITSTPLSQAIVAQLHEKDMHIAENVAPTGHRYADSPEFYDDPPPLLMDTSSSSDENNIPDVSSMESQFEPHHRRHGTTSTTPTQYAWSDTSLRNYFEDDNSDVRDLLVLVHDKSGSKEIKSHPSIAPLFAEANSQLKDLTSRLDGMLATYMQARSPNPSNT